MKANIINAHIKSKLTFIIHNYTFFNLNSNFCKFPLHISNIYYYISMKKLLTTFFALIILCPLSFAEDDIIDMDMNLIDSPSFSGRKAVTQEQFDNALEQKQMRSRGLIQKFRDFLNRNKPENDPVLKSFESDGSGEMGMSAKEINNSKPNVVLSSDIIDSYGKVIPRGHYQISYSDTDSSKTISFMQGSNVYGVLKAIDTKDNWHENSIIYARILYPSPSVARVIFSNLDVCVEGFARIAEPI